MFVLTCTSAEAHISRGSASGLSHACLLQVRLMHEHGYVLGNLDATIILQRPKLSPHKERIRENLCQLLGAHPSVINIKASANPVSSSHHHSLQGMHRVVCAHCDSGLNALFFLQSSSVCPHAGKDTREGGQLRRKPQHSCARCVHAYTQ